MVKSALLAVDMLNDFIYGTLKTPEAVSTVQPAVKSVSFFRKRSLPVVFLNDSHVDGDIEMSLWGKHAMKGTWGSKVIDDITPQSGELVIEKHFYSGFRETALNEFLESSQIKYLFLIGLDADICVRHTVADAFYLGYKTYVVRDAVAARIQKDWENYFKTVYGSIILDSGDLDKELEVLEVP